MVGILQSKVRNGFINFTNPDNGTFLIVPTFDYYFIGKKNRPYLGGGVVSYCPSADVYMEGVV